MTVKWLGDGIRAGLWPAASASRRGARRSKLLAEASWLRIARAGAGLRSVDGTRHGRPVSPDTGPVLGRPGLLMACFEGLAACETSERPKCRTGEDLGYRRPASVKLSHSYRHLTQCSFFPR